jgi:hypothetical protein
MRSSHNDRLPDRFDKQVSLEIEEGEHTTVRLQDDVEPDAWIHADIDVVESLSERR